MAMNVRVDEPRVPANSSVPGAVDKYVFEHTFRKSPTSLPTAAIIDLAAKNQIDGGLPDVSFIVVKTRALVPTKLLDKVLLYQLGRRSTLHWWTNICRTRNMR
jgi:hypothetical protein